MSIVADVLGVLGGAVAAAADLWWRLVSGRLLDWVGVVLAVCVTLSLAGHMDRRIERGRFYLTRRLHGYRSHGDYVGGHEWKARRRRFLAETGKRPCHICGKPWRDGPSGVGYHVHHVDYFRAGSGHESNRDLVPICHHCHTRVHKVDRYLGPFGTRALGLSLRRCTGLVRAVYWPVRALRGDSGTVPARRRTVRRPVSRRRTGARMPPARDTVRHSHHPMPDDVEHQGRPTGAGRSRTGD